MARLKHEAASSTVKGLVDNSQPLWNQDLVSADNTSLSRI